MPDRYLCFIALVKTFQDNNYQDFDALESAFFAAIFPTQTPDRLPVLVEAHRLIKLIKADVALLKASRSATKSQKYQLQIQARSDQLIEFCQRLATD